MSLSSLGLLGRKVGMMRLFTDEGDAVPVTVIDVSNNRVTQVKSQDTDGYVALQVTYGARKASRVTKPQAGHLAKRVWKPVKSSVNSVSAPTSPASTPPAAPCRCRTCSRPASGSTCRAPRSARASRAPSSATTSSRSASHGNSRSHNVPGSISMAQDPGRVFPGKKMSGHRGDVTVTTQNLDVIRVDETRGLLMVKGAVPGAKNGFVTVLPAVKGQPLSPRPRRSQVMQLELLNEQGQAASKFDAPETVFGREYNEALVHQIVVASRPMPVKARAPRRTASRSSTRPRSRSARRARAAPAPA